MNPFFAKVGLSLNNIFKKHPVFSEKTIQIQKGSLVANSSVPKDLEVVLSYVQLPNPKPEDSIYILAVFGLVDRG